MRMVGAVPVHMRREYGAPGLFQLQDHDIVGTAALQQGNVGPQSDAADADDLVGDIYQGVSAERTAPVRRQRDQVTVQSFPEQVSLIATNRHDKWRVVDDT